MNKVDYLEKELARLLAWVQTADTRVALVLPLSTAMLGALAVLAPAMDKWNIASAITTSFAMLLLSFSICCLAFASFPRTNGPRGSLIFFSGINEKELEQYRTSVNAMDEDSYTNDLINQCHINSRIAERKFMWVKRSLLSLFTSSIPWVLSVYMLYGIK